MINQDTIAAIATPPGFGGIGIIRISGPEAEDILRRVFYPAGNNPDVFESHRMVYGTVKDKGITLDECMAVLMRAPRSYTREDVAEIQLHGGSFVLNSVLDLCLENGARLAEAGEFTRRAFINGRVDLSQAEAVMNLINARGKQEHHAAMRQLNGGASSFIRKYEDVLVGLQAGIAACMDYPEEISDEEGTGRLKAGLEKLIGDLTDAVDEHASKMIHQGLNVALIGRPNVGKSSLLNGLLQEDRAIVTNVPGTTRDIVQGEMMLQGIRVILTDTAGIRETNDPVEQIGVERSVKAQNEADLTLLVLDGSERLQDDDIELLKQFDGPGAVIINKTDLKSETDEQSIHDVNRAVKCLTVSAVEPESLLQIREYLNEYAKVSDHLALTQPRHLEAARRAIRHLKDALKTLEQYSPDIASTDLQAAQYALSEITGEQADEKLLDRIFSSFCVGK